MKTFQVACCCGGQDPDEEMNEDMNDECIATHALPVWRDKADYILQADLAQYNMDERAEQLWAKQQSETEFMICCIPFFTYGIALGNTVIANDGFVVKVGHKGPYRNLRVAIIQGRSVSDLHVRLHDWVVREGLLYEWWKEFYLAVALKAEDTPDLGLLHELEQAGAIEYEVDGE